MNLTDERKRGGGGSHTCLIFDDPAVRRVVAARYLREGLSKGECGIYAASAEVEAEICAALTADGIDVARERERGALVFATPEAMYLSQQGGGFDPQVMLDLFRAKLDEAFAAGFTGCRFGGEPTFLADRPDLIPALVEYEAILNDFFPHHPACGLCVYDRRLYTAKMLRDIIRTHPVVMVNETVCRDNPYYEPPDLVLNPEAEKQRLDWMLERMTDVVKAEEALRQTRHALEIAAEAAEMGIWDLDLTRDFSGLRNLRHDQIFGYDSPQPAWGREIARRHLVEEDRAKFDEGFNRAMETGSLSFEVRVRRSNGDLRWMAVYGRLSFDANGRALRATGANFDITQRKEAEASLREAHEQLGNYAQKLEEEVRRRTEKLQETVSDLEAFSYSISHDMRAPLRAMNGYSQALLADRPALDETCRDYLERIARNARRLDNLIEDVLNYNRLARIDVSLKAVDLRPLLDEIVQNYPILQPQAAEIAVDGDLPLVLGHEVLFTQVFSNLLVNAVKFVSPGTKPKVTVRAVDAGSAVRIWVEDNGIGIASHNHERLFQIFQCINPPGLYEGTGIGLAIVKKAIDRMGGRVGVESEEGQGSRFWVEVPRPSE